MLAVDGQHRGHHLGARLLALAETYASAAGAASVCLNAVGPAVGFYRHHGYRPEAWPGCTACPTSTPMRKRLALGAALVPDSFGLPAVPGFVARSPAMTIAPAMVT
jgi:GNAT superfamily N-acetyltransferase